jgi:hypothetical protein
MASNLFLCFFFGLLSPVTAFLASDVQDKSDNQPTNSYGTIEGHVVTSEGMPVAKATVYAFRNGRHLLGVADEHGKFTLPVLVGKHRISAHKESEGYPDLLWSFYSEAYGREGFPIVNVEENQVVQGVIVRLGPKASRLFIRVIDAKTKRPIRDASLALNHKGKPGTLFQPGGTNMDGEFDTLIPPSVPINVVVKAPGYKTWRYGNRGSGDRDAIRLLPGSSKEMTVELKQLG